MYELERVLGPQVTRFVRDHVRSLLTWDVLVYFHRHPHETLDLDALARRLGRRVEELQPEVAALVSDGVLADSDSLLSLAPSADVRGLVADFADACQDRRSRLALIAMVLHKVNPRQE